MTFNTHDLALIDYDFAAGTMALRGDEPVLHTELVAALIGPPAHARAVA